MEDRFDGRNGGGGDKCGLSSKRCRNMRIFTFTIICIQFLSLYFIVFGVFCPVCTGLFKGMQLTLPLPTRMVIAVTEFFCSEPYIPRWPILVLLPGLVFAFFRPKRVIDPLARNNEGDALYRQGRLLAIVTLVYISVLMFVIYAMAMPIWPN